MKRHDLEVEGCYYLETNRYHDHRGFFQELYNSERYPIETKQVSTSLSKKGVLRGIHRSLYGKLVTCLTGSILDYCIDLREDSPTYLKHCKVELNSQESKQFYIPAGCGHMFITLEEDTLIVYNQEGTFNPNYEMDVNYKDVKINLNIDGFYVLSEKDNIAPSLEEAQKMFKKRMEELNNKEKEKS